MSSRAFKYPLSSRLWGAIPPGYPACALQAHTVQPSAMTALATRSEQSGTESCVVYGNVPDEA